MVKEKIESENEPEIKLVDISTFLKKGESEITYQELGKRLKSKKVWVPYTDSKILDRYLQNETLIPPKVKPHLRKGSTYLFIFKKKKTKDSKKPFLEALHYNAHDIEWSKVILQMEDRYYEHDFIFLCRKK